MISICKGGRWKLAPAGDPLGSVTVVSTSFSTDLPVHDDSVESETRGNYNAKEAAAD